MIFLGIKSKFSSLCKISPSPVEKDITNLAYIILQVSLGTLEPQFYVD